MSMDCSKALGLIALFWIEAEQSRQAGVGAGKHVAMPFSQPCVVEIARAKVFAGFDEASAKHELPRAIDRGAHGVALRRSAWPASRVA